MNRLTRKTTDEDYEEFRDFYYFLHKEACPFTKDEWIKFCPYQIKKEARHTNESLQKLYMLEDIEEELGCPLEVVFKALKNGIYVKDLFGDINFWECISIDYSKTMNNYYINQMVKHQSVRCNCVSVDNYNKTWWLEKPKEIEE